MRWGEKDNSFWCWSHSLALAARWQISVGMCLESGMRHWTRHCWLRKASLIHTVPTQFIYNIKLLIITGLCWTQRGRKRGKGPHWGKGQQGIFCLRLTMLLQMSSCCQPLAELPEEGSRLPACLRQWGIPVISLCFPAAHIIFHTAHPFLLAALGRSVPLLFCAVTDSDWFWSMECQEILSVLTPSLLCFHGGQQWEADTWFSSRSAFMAVTVGVGFSFCSGIFFWD